MAEQRGRWKKSSAGAAAIAVALVCFFPGSMLSGRDLPDDHKLDADFFKRCGRDFVRVVAAPVHWDGRDFLTLAAVSAAGLLIFASDQEIRDWAQRNRSDFSDDASNFVSYLGDGGVLLGLTAAIYAAGEICAKDPLRQTALLGLESLATASLLVWTLKAVSGRARPGAGESSRSFHPFAFKSHYFSLPSGHAAAAFAVATSIAAQTKSAALDGLLYFLAALPGLSRIAEDKHWASDVLVGSALGYFVAKKIADLNRPGKEKSLRLGFQFSRRSQALTLTLTF
jgi:hypothetical protein